MGAERKENLFQEGGSHKGSDTTNQCQRLFDHRKSLKTYQQIL